MSDRESINDWLKYRGVEAERQAIDRAEVVRLLLIMRDEAAMMLAHLVVRDAGALFSGREYAEEGVEVLEIIFKLPLAQMYAWFEEDRPRRPGDSVATPEVPILMTESQLRDGMDAMLADTMEGG